MNWEQVIAMVYPHRCPVCDGIPEYGERICPECEKKLAFITEPVCKCCGKPLETEREEYCYDCGRHTHRYDSGKALLVYQGKIKDSLWRFKYQNRREYAWYYAAQTAARYGSWIRQRGIEVIVPIPLHKQRRRQRGYNQAELYARHIGRMLGIPVRAELLRRVRQTVPQKQLNDVQRKNNLKKAFKCAPDIVQFKKILIVDDIYTTGSTIDAAAETLKSAGVQQVFFACISIGRGW